MEITYMDTTHIPEVVALEKQAFGKKALTEESLHSFFSAFYKGCLVALESGQVLGYITSERHKKESPVTYNHNAVATHKADGPYLYISGIVVKQDQRGQGIGSSLVEKLEEEARNITCFALYKIMDVNHPYGERAFNFWKKNGFSEKRRIEWAFQEGIYVEGILFEKKL